MKFKEISPQTEFGNLKRWVSENNVWEVRLDRMLFGIRLHVGLYDDMYFCLDYCLGDKSFWIGSMTSIVMRILEGLDENISQQALCDLFPMQRVKPMWNDPDCTSKIIDLIPDISEADSYGLKRAFSLDNT